ncbi:Two-component response regulator, YesN/AraC family, consists of REC and AraC-type DNA-binding domains [Paenibacillus algorifonticola]|uniref:Two-component response regulator, YesN/AraC family, consists of REC and AraC-type DNA-binding domains n=1 Tax=Paenibacillus algorifonticola TaxID=684063 RepID=A0A1I2HAY9_9BACL|nr:AraC family transcriptional regulator [Paenibacillus algorifonticola]SFF26543.1 Two-component response regulator, YesN/AraC family, consists of REC and AraC-type DNA-binding domains [Paenibacillus algorifonticola]
MGIRRFAEGWGKGKRAEAAARLRGSYFRRSLALVLLIACIPGLVMGIVMHKSITVKMENVLQRLHHEQIEQRARTIDEQLSALELSFSQWAFDPVFDNRLRQLDFVYKYKQVHELYRTLLIMNNSHTLVNRAELFLLYPQPLVMKPDRYDFIDDLDKIEQYKALLRQPVGAYWTRSFDGKAPMLVNRLPGGEEKPLGIVTTTLNENKLNRLLDTLTPYAEGETFLLDSDGSWLMNGSEPASPLAAKLREVYLQHRGSDESLRVEYGEEAYSVSYGSFRRLGTDWIYVSAAPMTAVIAPSLLISRFILAVSAGGLLLALALSWIGSLRIYSPVASLLARLIGDKRSGGGLRQREEGRDELGALERRWRGMERERETLRSRLEHHIPVIRESFLLQLTQGHLPELAEAELRERLQQLGGAAAQDGGSWAAMVVQFRGGGFGGGEPSSRQSEGDIASLAVSELLSQLTERRGYAAEQLHFHDGSIGLLLTLPKLEADSASAAREQEADQQADQQADDEPYGSERNAGEPYADEQHKQLLGLASELTAQMEQTLGLRLTVVVAGTVLELRRVPTLFEKAKLTLRHRLLASTQTVIDLAQQEQQTSDADSPYPFALENDIVYAIRSGNGEEAMEGISGFIGELASEDTGEAAGEQAVRYRLLQLLGTIQHAMMQAGANPVQLFEGRLLLDELQQLNHTHDVLWWFRHQVVDVFIREVAGKQEKQIQQVIYKMKEHVDNEYASVLSLEALADAYGMNSYTLSRSFKQAFDCNFIDYLTTVRLNHAKELLLHSDLKMNEIAELVGYQPSYFNRTFKKSEGITPSRYRDVVRNAGERPRLHSLGQGK